MRNAFTVVASLALIVLAWLAIFEFVTPSAAIDDRPAISQAPGRDTEHATEVAKAQTEAKQARDATASEVERKERAPAPTPNQDSVVLEGRCVDKATGRPVEGCKVEVDGWEANSDRMEAYRKLHGEVVWEDPQPVTTEPDGKFAFRFVPPPPYQFTLDVEHPRFVSMTGRWGKLVPGTKKDFGDVLMRGGSKVRGRVVDTDGIPQADVEVYIDQYNTYVPGRADGLGTRRYHQARTRSNGTFEFDKVIAYGKWKLRLRGRQKLSPESLKIPARQAVTVVEIKTKATSDVQTITGRVVDGGGEPLRSINVEYSPRAGGGGWMIHTNKDGRFKIERKDDDPDGPIQLRFGRRGYEALIPKVKYPWDTHGLEFAMKRGVDITVVVTDGKTGEPVEDYGVRCFPKPGSRGRSSSLDFRLREAGHHADGRVTLSGVRRGPQVLVVEPRGDTWLDSDLVDFEVDDEGPRVKNVKLYRPSTRTLVVRRTNGKPVVGTKVELLRRFSDHPVSTETHVVDLRGLSWSSGADVAIRLMGGQTDAQGEFVLRGPGNEALAVRVLGPGHQPVVVDDVELTADAPPIVVEVPSGATIVGKIGPARVLEQFRPKSATSEHQLPGIFLQRTIGRKHERYPTNALVNCLVSSKDGTFEVTGIPPGTWNVHFTYSLFFPDGRGSMGGSELLQTVSNLREGETRKLVADLAHLAFATVAGKVLLNGKPAGGATFQMLGKRPDGKGGEKWVGSPGIKLSEDGGFELRVIPATYQAGISLRSPQKRWVRLADKSRITLAPGRKYERVFDIRSGVLRLRILGPNDKPAGGVQVSLVNQEGTWGMPAPKTDAQGWTTLEPVLTGPLTVTVVRKRFLDKKALQEFLQANHDNPEAWKSTRVEIGRVHVNSGSKATKVELKLPAAAGY